MKDFDVNHDKVFQHVTQLYHGMQRVACDGQLVAAALPWLLSAWTVRVYPTGRLVWLAVAPAVLSIALIGAAWVLPGLIALDVVLGIVVLGDLNTFQFTNDLSEILPGTGCDQSAGSTSDQGSLAHARRSSDFQGEPSGTSPMLSSSTGKTPQVGLFHNAALSRLSTPP